MPGETFVRLQTTWNSLRISLGGKDMRFLTRYCALLVACLLIALSATVYMAQTKAPAAAPASADQIARGKYLVAGRAIMPPMPWKMYSNATDADLKAIFAYLKTVPPIKNKVPDPIMAKK